jgi:hypothetical protein
MCAAAAATLLLSAPDAQARAAGVPGAAQGDVLPRASALAPRVSPSLAGGVAGEGRQRPGRPAGSGVSRPSAAVPVGPSASEGPHDAEHSEAEPSGPAAGLPSDARPPDGRPSDGPPPRPHASLTDSGRGRPSRPAGSAPAAASSAAALPPSAGASAPASPSSPGGREDLAGRQEREDLPSAASGSASVAVLGSGILLLGLGLGFIALRLRRR